MGPLLEDFRQADAVRCSTQSIARHPPETRAEGYAGPYRLLELVGEGGMGAVYLAEQTEPIHRKVAVKVIKRGMDTKEVVARFESERQASALMNHPSIARVLDAGSTADGRPFFVMEYVPGEPITRYCDRHRLSTAERLDLFLQVCSAVQHAHQKAIIHRDLKPTNVLVMSQDGKSFPKIIDFGVAKATNHRLTERTLFTELGQIIGTPEYMSPEQAEMGTLDIDTRTDIYSLGVLLYELLTGELPFDSKELRQAGYAEIQRIIREREPQRPSTRLSTLRGSSANAAAARRTDLVKLLRELRGDLDWIVMKAIDKDRTRRYGTAMELGADIERHLRHEPVLARPPSAAYRLKKHLRKHRGPVAATAAVILALVSGLAVATVLYVRAEGERIAKTEALAKEQQALAAKEAALADREEALAEKNRVLIRSDGFRLTAQASVALPLDPGLALLLAIEGAEKQPGLLSNNTLLSVLEDLWEEMTLVGPTAFVRSIEFSPDGRQVVTASSDGTLRLWDASSGEERLTLAAHRDNVHSAEFSADGRRVVTASSDRTSRIWDASDGKELGVLAGHEGWVRAARFSADGGRVVTASDDTTARIWEAASGKELLVLRGHTDEVVSVDLSTDGTRVITASRDCTARTWDALDGTQLGVLHGHEGAVWHARFSPDGARSTTASEDGSARIWDLAHGKEVLALKGHGSAVVSSRFSRDGLRLVTASRDGTARIWDASSGSEVRILKGHGGPLNSAVFSPDGRRAATTSDDGTARIWNAREGGDVITLQGHESDVFAARFSADGRRVVTMTLERSVRTWDAATGQELGTTEGLFLKARVARLSPDGEHLVLASDEPIARVLEASTEREILVLRGHEGVVRFAEFSPDGRRLATASDDGTVRIWDASSGKQVIALGGHRVSMRFAEWSLDGRRMMALARDGALFGERSPVIRLFVWELATGKELLNLHGKEREDVLARMSPNGERVVTAEGTAEVWDVLSARRLLKLQGHERRVSYAEFSPDGRLIVTASSDGTARIWDAANGSELLVLRGHSSRVSLARFSPDGQVVATASADGTARIWDAASGRELATLKTGLTSESFSVHFSPDGKRLVTPYFQRTARIWPVHPLEVARRRKPRDFTLAERDDYEIGSAAERLAHRRRRDARDLRRDLEAAKRALSAAPGDPSVPWSYLSTLRRAAQWLAQAETGTELAAAAKAVDGDRDAERLRSLLSDIQELSRNSCEVLGICGELEAARKDFRAAVLTLERAVKLPGPGGRLLSKLAEYRRALVPDLVSYASIDAAVEEATLVSVVPEGAEWRFHRGRSEPSAALEWTGLDFDDRAWEKGPGGFGYGDADDATVLDDMEGSYTTVYLRHVFELPEPARKGLSLSVVADDGFVAYLNGSEVRRWLAGAAGVRVPFDGAAAGNAPEPPVPVDIAIDPKLLSAGRNVLAIQGLNQSRESSDLSLNPVVRGPAAPDPARDREWVERLRAAARGPDAPARAAYLEGKLLVLAGKPREAAARFQEAVTRDWTRPEPHLALASSLRAAGNATAGVGGLREALEGGIEGTKPFWDLWFAFSAVDLKLGEARLLGGLPSAPRGEGAVIREDLRWLLERLIEERAVRIRCGGEEYRSPGGTVWGRDRFFTAGFRYFGDNYGSAAAPFTGAIEGTDDDPLYQTERWFYEEDARPAAYRIPLPPAHYRVTLHFAEIYFRAPARRTFDVRIERKTILEGYDPGAGGFATADRKMHETLVEDGFLDIEFLRREIDPKISAIEVDRLTTTP